MIGVELARAIGGCSDTTWSNQEQRTDHTGAAVLARQRQAYILDRVREEGGVRVAELVRDLGVSDMTIRRDMERLHESGLIEKVHGGAAALPGSALFEPGFTAKSGLQEAEKEAIVDAAVGLIEPGTAIGISAGTTTYALARRLVDIVGLTVVTNSVRVADVLHDAGRPDQTIIMTGGVRTPSDALVGPFAVAALRSVHVDLVFMGVHGMDAHSGFTSPNMMEAETNRAMIEAGGRLVVVADHTKWGQVALSSIARLDQANIVITDAGLEASAQEVLRSRVRELRLVDPTAGAWVGGGSNIEPNEEPVQLSRRVAASAADRSASLGRAAGPKRED
jgi:DeoR/GlpR family transcriptional regulator of sugar metabolism